MYDDDVNDLTCVRQSVKQDPSVSHVACCMLKRQKTSLIHIFRKVRGNWKKQIRYPVPDLHFPGTEKLFVRIGLSVEIKIASSFKVSPQQENPPAIRLQSTSKNKLAKKIRNPSPSDEQQKRFAAFLPAAVMDSFAQYAVLE